MGYYTQFMARQAELTRSTMEQARKALLEEAESEEAYRQSLMDRQKDLVELQAGITKKLASAGKMTDSDWKWYFTQKKSLETARSSRQLRTQSELQDIADKARFDRAKIAGLADEVARSAATGSVGQMIDMIKGDSVAGIVRGSAERAKQSGTAAQHDYALALETFMRQQFSDEGKELSPKEVGQLRQAAAEIAGVDARMVNEASVQQMVEADKKKFNSLISKPEAELLAELERWKDSPRNEEQTRLIKAALATKLAEGGVEEAEIESQLEALGRPMEVTEEAVRGRTQEMMEPYKDISPFPIASALAKRIQKRRGDKAMADFEDMDEDSKIIYQNSLKAQQYLADFGGQLPPEDQMNTIEWDRARDIMEKIQSGTLPKTAMIRIAQQFAEKDLGRGAPPTDVRRQRDEIIERVLMLNRIGAWSSESSVKPPPKPEPVTAPVVDPAAVPAAAAPAGTGRGATTPASDPLAAEMGVTQAQADAMNPPYIPQYPPDPVLNPPSVAQQERVSEQDFRLQEIDEGTRLAGQDRRLQEIEAQAQANRIIEQDRRLQEIDRGSAVADVLVPPPTQAPTTTAPPRRASSFYGRPVEEQLSEYWAEAKKGIGREIIEQVPALLDYYGSPNSGLPRASMAQDEVVRFSQSQSITEIPGGSRKHDLMAQAAIAMGLPVPGWYRQATPQIAQR